MSWLIGSAYEPNGLHMILMVPNGRAHEPYGLAYVTNAHSARSCALLD